jgi:hypothetical protein
MSFGVKILITAHLEVGEVFWIVAVSAVLGTKSPYA